MTNRLHPTLIVGPRFVQVVTVLDGKPIVPGDRRAQLVAEFPIRSVSSGPTTADLGGVAYVTRSGERWFVDVYDLRTRRSGAEQPIIHVLDRSFEIVAPPDGTWIEQRDVPPLRRELLEAIRH